MRLRLRNEWNYADNDRWDWEVYLFSDNPSDLDSVEYVKYILHPTFPNPVRIVKDRANGFRLRTKGWGTFLIRAFVYLKNGDKIKLEHSLDLKYDPPRGSSP